MSENAKDDVIARVETFIDRLLNGIIRFTAHSHEQYGMHSRIAAKIHDYQKCAPDEKKHYAIRVLEEIDDAYAHGYIENGSAFISRLAWYEENYTALKKQYAELKEKHQKLADDFIFIQGKNKQLEELLERIVPKGKDIDQ